MKEVHFELMCKFLGCRIGLYSNGQLRKFGKNNSSQITFLIGRLPDKIRKEEERASHVLKSATLLFSTFRISAHDRREPSATHTGESEAGRSVRSTASKNGGKCFCLDTRVALIVFEAAQKKEGKKKWK